MPGTLVLCATPIGNLSDLSDRAAEALTNADVVFAEDTRRTAKLLQHIGATTRMKSFHAHNEKSRLGELASHLEEGHMVVLVSDAGMPTVSDPGVSAVSVAVEIGAEVTVVPGPSAVVTALAISGFDGDRFVFEGFLPRKGAERSRVIKAIGSEGRTVVFFSAPHRLLKDLADILTHTYPDREVVLGRELTKLHEEVWRGGLESAVTHWSGIPKVRGEITVVVAGASAVEPDLDEAARVVERPPDQGIPTSDAVREVALTTGVRPRELYEQTLRERCDLVAAGHAYAPALVLRNVFRAFAEHTHSVEFPQNNPTVLDRYC